MRLQSLIACLVLFPSFATAQSPDVTQLRHDEALMLDEIRLQPSAVCLEAGVPRSRSIRVDTIRFLDSGSNAVGTIDVGGVPDAYDLGQGWLPREATSELNWRWIDGKAPRATAYRAIPAQARSVSIRAASACVAVTTGVFVNGSRIGEFVLAANSALTQFTIPLPTQMPGEVSFAVNQGGPLSITSIEWLNSAGGVISTSPTAVQVGADGTWQRANATRPAGTSSFCVNLAAGAPLGAALRVAVNNAAGAIVRPAVGGTKVCALELDLLESLADRKTRTGGWGEDFNARNAFGVMLQPSFNYPEITNDGDAVSIVSPGNQTLSVVLDLPEAMAIAQTRYLALRIKVTKGGMYFIRPTGYNAALAPVALWYEEAPTDDRIGTGEWETLTVSLPRLVQEAGTGATHMTAITLVMLSPGNGPPVTMSIDWVRVHAGLRPPGPLPAVETNFTNHIDDDGDGFTDRDDPDWKGPAGSQSMWGLDRPPVFAWYHLWYGNPSGPSRSWLAWAFTRDDGAVNYNPETFDPAFQGKRNIGPLFYPLNIRDFPDYVPPANGQYTYNMHGGLEQYDTLDAEYVQRQTRLARSFGIQGFLGDVGHQAYLRPPQEVLVKAAEGAPAPFGSSVLYDFYYPIPSVGLNDAQPEHAMAREMHYFYDELAQSPRWLNYRSKPLLTAPFSATLIPSEKWDRVAALATDPRASELDGVVNPGTIREGANNQVQFTFSEALVNSNLSMRFQFIVFRDAALREVGRLKFGTPETRALLGSGWGTDIVDFVGGTWAQGAGREATMRMEIPARTEYMDLHVASAAEKSMMTMSINGGAPVKFLATRLGNIGYFRFSAPSVPVADASQRPFALMLNERGAAERLDGFVSYNEYRATGGSKVMVSSEKPSIWTVEPGYDDRKIRVNGFAKDRENGMRYRRQWEEALAHEPDAVFINSWNEWPESTNIEPTVEFGYQYLELTLTYSLMLGRQMSVSRLPSEIGLTVRRHQPDHGANPEIRFAAGGPATVTFRGLAAAKLSGYTVTRGGQPFNDHRVMSGDLIINTVAGAGEYRIAFASPPAGTPVISLVANAASSKAGPIAPGEFISIYGQNLGPETGVSGFDRVVGGTRVRLNGADCFVTYSSAGQVNAVVTGAASTAGSAQIVVERNGISSAPDTVALDNSAPALFTQQFGAGQVWLVNQDNSFNSAANAAERGSFVAFFATGQGVTNPALPDGQHPSAQPLPTPVLEVSALLNGRPIPKQNIVFSGLIFSGVMQINVKIPDDAPTGSAVELQIGVGGELSRRGATIAIR